MILAHIIVSLALAQTADLRLLARYGEFQLPAATASYVPIRAAFGNAAIVFQNTDSAPVFCGYDLSVTNIHFGFSIAAGGQTPVLPFFNVDHLYCYSVAGMGAASLHYMEF